MIVRLVLPYLVIKYLINPFFEKILDFLELLDLKIEILDFLELIVLKLEIIDFLENREVVF